MDNNSSRHTEKRLSDGEKLCQEWIDWIHHKRRRAERAVTDRVLKLFEDLFRLYRLWEKELKDVAEQGDIYHKSYEAQYPLINQMMVVNQSLMPYLSVPCVRPTDRFEVLSLEATIERDGSISCDSHWLGSPKSEHWAVFTLLRIAESQLLPKISRCSCGVLFFKKFSHQRFHSEDCRIQSNLSSAKWREYNRAKQREYYWLHKHKNVK